MDELQQANRGDSYLIGEGGGAAQRVPGGSLIASDADGCTESLVETGTETLMEEVVSRENLKRALKRVRSNKGAAGVDGMQVAELPEFLKQHWPALRSKLLAGLYQPQPVRRVEIPKPGGGVRKLGIPTVLDRFIQQALHQVLQQRWDGTFSEKSYGFRPGRSAHQAVKQAQEYICAGYSWTVDIDLEQFFDRVNHDRLMSSVANRVRDKRVLKLIRRFLNSGVLEGGLVQPTTEGAPQGGPLSPLLSNLVLDELDKELERRGHRFVRYADDCNIYVRSEAAGERVMKSITGFITKRLKLRVNRNKSAVARPWRRKFLGFSFEHRKKRVVISSESQKRFKERVRQLTRRTCGKSVVQVIRELSCYLQSWYGYYRLCQTKSLFTRLDKWIRRRLRCLQWKQWGRRGYRELRNRGVGVRLAWNTSSSAKSWWRLCRSPAIYGAMPNSYFDSLGLASLHQLHST